MKKNKVYLAITNSKIIIGAGSVVIKSLKKQGSYFGNPAKKIF